MSMKQSNLPFSQLSSDGTTYHSWSHLKHIHSLRFGLTFSLPGHVYSDLEHCQIPKRISTDMLQLYVISCYEDTHFPANLTVFHPSSAFLVGLMSLLINIENALGELNKLSACTST